MTTVTIAVVTLLSGYLGIRLGNARGENAALRAQVASLKRQLVGRRS